MNIRYKDYNITITLDMDNKETVYHCERRIESVEGVDVFVKSDVFEVKKPFPMMILEFPNIAKQIIDEHLITTMN